MLHLGAWEIPQKRELKDCMSQEEWSIPEEHGPLDQISREHMDHRDRSSKQWTCMGMYQLFCICCGCQTDSFERLLSVGVDMSLTLLPAVRTSSFLLHCLLPLWCEGIYLVSVSFVFLCLVIFSQRPTLSLQKMEGKWIQQRQKVGVGLGGDEGGETVVECKRRIYFQ